MAIRALWIGILGLARLRNRYWSGDPDRGLLEDCTVHTQAGLGLRLGPVPMSLGSRLTLTTPDVQTLLTKPNNIVHPLPALRRTLHSIALLFATRLILHHITHPRHYAATVFAQHTPTQHFQPRRTSPSLSIPPSTTTQQALLPLSALRPRLLSSAVPETWDHHVRPSFATPSTHNAKFTPSQYPVRHSPLVIAGNSPWNDSECLHHRGVW